MAPIALLPRCITALSLSALSVTTALQLGTPFTGRVQRALVASVVAATGEATPSAPSVVWLGHGDCRLHDHEALADAAEQGKPVLPLYVLDAEALGACSLHELACRHAALSALSASLERAGCGPLQTLTGGADGVAEVAVACGATCVAVHDDPTTECVSASTKAAAALAEAGIEFRKWRSTLRPVEALPQLDQIDARFDQYKRSLGATPLIQPRAAPSALRHAATPTLPGLTTGLPSLGEFVALARSARTEAVDNAFLRLRYGDAVADRAPVEDSDLHTLLGGDSLWATPPAVKCTEACALELLDSYFGQGEVSFGQGWLDDVVSPATTHAGSTNCLEHAAMKRIVGTKGVQGGLSPGEVFSRVFGPLLGLGVLSPRQLLYPSARAKAAAGATALSGWRAAREAAEAHEWHQLLATHDLDQQQPNDPITVGYWRWRGFLTRFAVGGETGANAADTLLVHGFGASATQWRKMMLGMLDEGKERRLGGRVTALDMLGFGHAQAPVLTYTQYAWSDQVREFALANVGRPFVVAGNSIGGFMAATVAADTDAFLAPEQQHNRLCAGLALLNTAGRILEDAQLAEETAKLGGLSMRDATLQGQLKPFSAPPEWVLDLFARGLFAFLQPRIQEICVNVYPTDPSQVDDVLCRNILRDSKDPGALSVMASGAKLPPPRTLNELFKEFGGPVAVLQGLEDPLNDSRERAAGMERLGACLEPLVAGHCPHDEKPLDCAKLLLKFLDSERVRGGAKEAVVLAQ